jgi:hypothetical protein
MQEAVFIFPAAKSPARIPDRSDGRVLNRSDQFVSDKARTSSSLALFFIAALIAVGATFVWHSQGDEAKEMVRRRWALSLDWLLSMSTHTRDMLHNRLGC